MDIGNPSKGSKGEPLSIFLFSDSMEVSYIECYQRVSLCPGACVCRHVCVCVLCVLACVCIVCGCVCVCACALMLILLQVAKRRATSNFTLRNSSHKAFKHVEFVPLTHVRSIVHFGEAGGEYYITHGLGMGCV